MHDEPTMYEAMTWKLAADGYSPTPLEEVRALGLVLPGEESRPVEERAGRILGMLKHLQSRPLTAGPGRSRDELALQETLRGLRDWALELAHKEPEDLMELNEAAEDRARFEEVLYAATVEFFELLAALDEPFGV